MAIFHAFMSMFVSQEGSVMSIFVSQGGRLRTEVLSLSKNGCGLAVDLATPLGCRRNIKVVAGCCSVSAVILQYPPPEGAK